MKDTLNIHLGERLLLIKETTAHMSAIKWVESSLENIKVNDNATTKLIWIVRDINHSYLSRVHTARKYWGHPKMKIDSDSFKEYIDFANQGFESIEKLAKNHDSCMISYEKLVTDTEETLRNLMDFIGIDLHPNQLEYHRHFKKHKSAGDPEVSSNPKPVTVDKVVNKDKEWEEYKDTFLKSLTQAEMEKYKKLEGVVNDIRSRGFKKL